MINWLICKLKGHKKYDPNILNGNDLMTISDSLGVSLVRINVCKRCGELYTDLRGKQ